MEKFDSKNVFGEALSDCSQDPVTGFFRDGCCNTNHQDQGMHTICVRLTDDFLEFSKAQGNDLSTPKPEFNFSGLKAGDSWCLCAPRWVEAYKQGVAPQVNLSATHEETLAIVPLELLKEYAF